MNVIALTSVRPDCARAAPGFPESRRPAMTDDRMTEDLMTRRQVASMFGVTSAAVASWARRGRLPEVRNEAAATVPALGRGGAVPERYEAEGAMNAGYRLTDAPGPQCGCGLPESNCQCLHT